MNQHQPATKEVAAWIQTRIVLRIIFILLAVAALLWVVYKLTTILLLLVLSIFFAYLVAPLVDLVERPVRVGGRERRLPRGVEVGSVNVVIFGGVGVDLYILAIQS